MEGGEGFEVFFGGGLMGKGEGGGGGGEGGFRDSNYKFFVTSLI